jgi:hypothetical protein
MTFSINNNNNNNNNTFILVRRNSGQPLVKWVPAFFSGGKAVVA